MVEQQISIEKQTVWSIDLFRCESILLQTCIFIVAVYYGLLFLP